MPEKVVMEKADDFHGLFTFKPLEKGYGVTVGNALRRILLSSLEGYAITGIKIPGVLHEFSTVDGIVEDVSESANKEKPTTNNAARIGKPRATLFTVFV